MTSKRMTLSLIAMISSVFLFVFASFAWLTLSKIVDIGGPSLIVDNIDADAAMYVSMDGENYIEVGSIFLNTSVSGTTQYYHIVLQNTGDVPIDSKVVLYGFTNGVADPLGDDSNYLAGKTLIDVIRVSASNDANSEIIDNQTMISLMPVPLDNDYSESSLFIVEDIYLDVLDTVTISFSFTIDGDLAGNDYQNLLLNVSKVYIQSVGN